MRRHSHGRGLRQPSHGMHGRPCAPVRHILSRWIADVIMSMTPQCQNTYVTLQSGRRMLLHPRWVCTQLCCCGRRIWSGGIFFSLG